MAQKSPFRYFLSTCIGLLGRRWPVALGVVAAFTLCGFAFGFWNCKSTVMLTLTQAKVQVRELQTLAEILRSDEFSGDLNRTSGFQMTTGELLSLYDVEFSPAAQALQVKVRGRTPEQASLLARAIARSAANALTEWRIRNQKQASTAMDQQLEQANEALEISTRKLIAARQETSGADWDNDVTDSFQKRGELESKLAENKRASEAIEAQANDLQQQISAHHPDLLAAQQALQTALLRYTDDHPKIQELKQTLAAIEMRIRNQRAEVDPSIALSASNLTQNLYSKLLDLRNQTAALKEERTGLENSLRSLAEKVKTLPERQRTLAALKSDFELRQKTRQALLKSQLESLASAQQETSLSSVIVLSPRNRVPVQLQAGLVDGGLAGSFAAVLSGLALLGESLCSRRISSLAALQQATELPLLGTLGNLEKMTLEDRKNWAFFTFAKLKQKLSPSNDAAFVCGFTSSGFGEGKSTWVNLLAEAATRQGYPVLVISAGMSELHAPGSETEEPVSGSQASPNALVAPPRFSQALTRSSGRRTVPVSLLGWAWSIDGRVQWQKAVEQLNGLENQVVLVDLPPASQPETHLLAKSLPNVLWVCGEGVAQGAATRQHLNLLSDLGSRVVGVVMNKSEALRS